MVVAEEIYTNPKLSSTATVTVSITDANDNAPIFENDVYTATVLETASAGTLVTTITARDMDSGSFGENGIVYQLFGSGSERFIVNNKTGVITVAPCITPGHDECLDFETKPVYFLSYKVRTYFYHACFYEKITLAKNLQFLTNFDIRICYITNLFLSEKRSFFF